MNNFKEELLKQEAAKTKKKAIEKLGAIDFHFQVPNFEHPLMILPILINEMLSYGRGMVEFHTEKAENCGELLKSIEHISHGDMYGIWNTWNTVIGMVLTSKDPVIMSEFHEMMKGFAEEQIMGKSEKEGN
jgi:hypothetical protein